jgi:hypothetical protein
LKVPIFCRYNLDIWINSAFKIPAIIINFQHN